MAEKSEENPLGEDSPEEIRRMLEGDPRYSIEELKKIAHGPMYPGEPSELVVSPMLVAWVQWIENNPGKVKDILERD